MSEVLPDPSLPIFADKFVSYTIAHPRSTEVDSEWETVKVPVDEIDEIEDHRFREALWLQFKLREENARTGVFIFANDDGSYRHSILVPTRRLGVTFTQDGPIEDKDLPAYREQKEQERLVRETKAGGWIGRLVRRK